MTQYRLDYFDFSGGRGEALRIILHIAGIEFDDNRLSFQDFGQARAGYPFNAIPVMEMDGEVVTQSNALSRYFGQQAGLYPTDAKQALYCDEVIEAAEDLTHFIVRTFGLEGDALKAAREKFLAERLIPYLKSFDQLLQRGGGQYFAGNALSIADIKIMIQTRQLSSGNLDYIPAITVEEVAPNLIAHANRIDNDPRVLAYHATLG